ncbi:MAG: CheY-like chemotaxis protein/anti-sigma regulatory factor (Ser/Thr protein kinase) [Mariniblastus sp.]|jgi:CheY-like chemotaxis protein/anti-sigma regulatory factor (Ser/Thr protein kinase)
MPIILVVDDSETDRMLIGGLLKPKLDWIVQYAKDGAEGLEMLGSVFPDLVVTDLQMPELNGIQLCAEAKAEYPHVPIILVTGQGSEDLAMEALQAGAASYVPKCGLSKYLLETVEQLLSLATHDMSKERLMQDTTSARFQFNLTSDQSIIAPLIDYISSNMVELKIGDQSEQRHVSVAIEESVLNAIFHGNFELGPDAVRYARQQMHDGSISEEVAERCALLPYRDRKIKIAVELNRKQVSIVVRDDGAGFDVAAETLKALELGQLSNEDGRGLTLMHTLMDEVAFNDLGNEVRLNLRIKTPAQHPVSVG